MDYKIKILKKDGINMISRDKKKFLININKFTEAYKKGSGLNGFLDSLSEFNSAKDLKKTIELLYNARKSNKPIVLLIDQSIILSGLNKIIIDLIERGWISLIAVNTDFAISDFEIALSGKTIEDLKTNLIKNKKGYGNTEETGIFFNIALKEGMEENRGAGEAIGHYLIENEFSYKDYSVVYNSFKYNVPLTLHQTKAYDFIGFHIAFDPVVYGRLLDKDFLIFNSFISNLSQGGVLFFCMKEYNFLDLVEKSLAFCINKGIDIKEYYSIITGNKNIYNDYRDYLLYGGKKLYLSDSIEIILPLVSSLIIDLGGRNE